MINNKRKYVALPRDGRVSWQGWVMLRPSGESWDTRLIAMNNSDTLVQFYDGKARAWLTINDPTHEMLADIVRAISSSLCCKASMEDLSL